MSRIMTKIHLAPKMEVFKPLCRDNYICTHGDIGMGI